jgi:hypothetical protein
MGGTGSFGNPMVPGVKSLGVKKIDFFCCRRLRWRVSFLSLCRKVRRSPGVFTGSAIDELFDLFLARNCLIISHLPTGFTRTDQGHDAFAVV